MRSRRCRLLQPPIRVGVAPLCHNASVGTPASSNWSLRTLAMRVCFDLQRLGLAIVVCCAGLIIMLAWLIGAPYAYLLIAIAVIALIGLLIQYKELHGS